MDCQEFLRRAALCADRAHAAAERAVRARMRAREACIRAAALREIAEASKRRLVQVHGLPAFRSPLHKI